MTIHENRYTMEINRLIDSLTITIQDAQTMLAMPSGEDFFNFEDKVIYDYFGALKRRLVEAVQTAHILQHKFASNLLPVQPHK